MIYCCGEEHWADSIRLLFDNNIYENRKIEILNCCPKCGKKKAVLTQWRIKDGKLVKITSKKGNIDSFIKKYAKEPWEEGLKTPKVGTMSNMGWVYLDGSEEVAKDFNDVEKEDVSTPVKILDIDFVKN